MADFFKKNAKLLIVLYGVIIFATLISGLFYMTSVANIHVYYEIDGDKINYNSDSSITDGVTNANLFTYFGNANVDKPDYVVYEFGTDPNNGLENSVYFAESGYAEIVYNFQMAMSNFNTQIIVFSIVALLCFAVMMIFSNHSRKVYYKSNLYAGCIMPLIVIIYSVVMLIQNFVLMGVFNKNFDLFRTVSVLQDPKIKDASKLLMATDYQRILNNSEGFGPSCYWIQAIFFIVVIVYSIFLIVYTMFRYNDSSKRRKEIIARAVQNND